MSPSGLYMHTYIHAALKAIIIINVHLGTLKYSKLDRVVHRGMGYNLVLVVTKFATTSNQTMIKNTARNLFKLQEL